MATFLQPSLGKTTSCTVTPCLALRRQPFCDLGSTNHFVPEIVLALQTRAKPINILVCFCSKEQEVKCYNLTFGPDLLRSASLTDRMLIKMSVFFLHELYNPQICPWRLLLILFNATTINRVFPPAPPQSPFQSGRALNSIASSLGGNSGP